jgi:hypothetical protein
MKDVVEFVNNSETYEQMRLLLAPPFIQPNYDDMPPLIPIIAQPVL